MEVLWYLMLISCYALYILIRIIGERSEPSLVSSKGNYLLPSMAVFGCIYIYISAYVYICRMFIHWRMHGGFYGFDGIWWSVGDFAMGMLDSEMVDNYEIYGCRFEGQWKSLDPHTNVWLSGNGYWSFILTKLLNSAKKTQKKQLWH